MIRTGRIEGGGRHGKPLTEVVAQAKDYAGKLQLRFTYASNGKGVYAIGYGHGQSSYAVARVICEGEARQDW